MNLPKDYEVEGLLVSGTWDLQVDDRHMPYLCNALNKFGVKYEIKKFEDVNAGHAHEITINNKNYWFVPVMGTAIMSIYAHTASMLGSKKNLLIGVVGGLQKAVKPGDLIIPDKIKGNDNALKYQPHSADKFFYPDKRLKANIIDRFPKDTPLHQGKTVTCEVLLAETEEDVINWSKEGYLGVEMEGAMIFALSNHFHIPSMAIFSVSDNLIENETLLHESHEQSKEIRNKARELQYDIAIQELLDADKEK